MSYTLILPVPVENRIYDYALYIAQDAPTRAVAWVEEVFAKLDELQDMPLAYPVADDETSLLGFEVRKRAIGSYLAIYRVLEDAGHVVVVDFRHGAERPRK